MFKPFEKGTESHINLYGNLQINKDQDGLLIAKTLQAFLMMLMTALEQEKHLPTEN